ncbi:CwfJ C-terminus 1-domain-containing protein-like protein [Schizophyllum amplum]|uniref:CwfJ C-terminus 1-domain-containing protein-like protein n=1 Tax=Schizophyllum amplum TaxID=97359 RepID=A0A550CH37_9AGAR|nr:CwfJ C-terminus 1-domain-containing protein-like protein [Auriculariopsis ampla]
MPDEQSTSKRRHREKDDDKKSKKRHKHHDDDKGGKHKHKRKRTDDGKSHIRDEDMDEDVWVEKNIDMEGEQVSNCTPTSANVTAIQDESFTDGYGDPAGNSRTADGQVDFFSSLGTEHRKNLRKNLLMRRCPCPTPKKNVPGGPGSSWRMMRLRKVYEAAEEGDLPLEEIARDRFGSLEAFEEAKEERRILDEREARQRVPGGGPRGMMFTDVNNSGMSSRSSSFRKPGADSSSAPGTPSPSGSGAPANRRLDSLRLPSQSRLAQSHTPVPSAACYVPSSLNRLQAKVLRAKLMGSADAEALEREYDSESRKANGKDVAETGVRTKVEVLPTLDSRGRLYDLGTGNRKKKEKNFETRDPKTGDLVRYNADDDELTLGEMLRQERFGAGMADQKDLDAQFAKAIMGDGKFENDLDYIDDNAEKLGRQKMRTDAMKRQFAIHDYKKTQQVLSTCTYCYGEDDSPPKAPVVAMGTRAYLSCTTTEELVPGHCIIVPIQHHLSMLEADDDVWDEVRNFMKCLMRMFAEEDKGVVFYETVLSLKWQAHTVIECVPVPWEHFEVIPGYFKESILASEAEWSQHKKLIDFSARPGGFRRAMVPNLPYFMVQFDYKGEKGYGHVIEGGATAEGDEEGVDEGEKGGGEFPKYFAGEIPRRWRRPKRVDFHSNRQRVAQFKRKYDKFDWTGMIGKA